MTHTTQREANNGVATMEIEAEQNLCMDRTENGSFQPDSDLPLPSPDTPTPTTGQHGARRGGAPRQNENESRQGLKVTKFALAAFEFSKEGKCMKDRFTFG